MVLWGEKNGYHSVDITNTSTHSTFCWSFYFTSLSKNRD